MRRNTITPCSRRPTISTPLNQQKLTRYSVSGEENKRRDMRKIRDPTYKQQCVEIIYNFLYENNYDQQLTYKTLYSPSAKDFQHIFKFLYSFIENYDYGTKFEDDFLQILKNIRYPFGSEITRSQLIAITPHTWPVILSMLSWMVSLIEKNIAEGTKDVDLFFHNFVCEGYLRFMDGNEDDSELEEAFEKKIETLHKESFAEIEKLKANLENLEKQLEETQVSFEDIENIEYKKADIIKDIEYVIQQRSQVDEKIKKYKNIIEQTKEEIQCLSKQLEVAKAEQDNLKEQIDIQKINPEDIKIMNTEKIDLYKELERIKPEKESLFKSINSLEQDLWAKIEEFEKLSFDFKTLVKDVKINIAKDHNLVEDAEIEGNLDAIYLDLEESLDDKRKEVLYLNDTKNKLEEKRSEHASVLLDYEEKIKYMNDKLFRTGKLYIEKKEVSGIEQRKSQKEMERIENELLKLNLESNSSLLLGEQALQRAKIELDRTISNINYEKEEISKAVSSFYQKMESQLTSITNTYKEILRLTDESFE